MTYDQWQTHASTISDALITHRGGFSANDIAHFIWQLEKDGRSIEWILWDIAGQQGAEPGTPVVSVPPASVDLSSWPRRGATIAQSLLDTRWNYATFADHLGCIFSGRALTQVNVLSALWPDMAPHAQFPFRQRPDGKWDLEDLNPLFFDRLPRYVETMNARGVVVQLCFLELYSWSYRKQGVPFDKNLSPFRHNVNGIYWGGDTRADDDLTLTTKLPGPWLTWLIERVLEKVRGAGVAVVPFNEGPEKPVHFDIAATVKRVAPEVRVVVNRNEDTPGQYMNMDVGGRVDMIAFHGWDDLGFLRKDFPDEPSKRPRNFQQFFDRQSRDGRALNIDFARVICSSDGSRSSDDPVNTYNWPELLKVFRFVTEKGGSIEHQSRAKMTPGARLDTLELDFLTQMAAL